MKDIRFAKLVLFVNGVVPLVLLLWDVYRKQVGANPLEFVTRTTGMLTLAFLLITLAISPLRRITGLNWLIRFRRMLGLFAFFYGFLHLMTFVGLDKFFDVAEMWKDVLKRPFITAGFTGFMLIVPLAITSTSGWVRRLGYRRWQLLHRLIYFSALAGVIHYYWLVKSDVRLPLMYGGILAVLLLYRMAAWLRKGLIAKARPALIPR